MSRAQTVLRREGAGPGRTTSPPSPIWSPDYSQLPTPSEQHEIYSEEALMSLAPGKTSSDSGQAPGTSGWSKRQLRRLDTEQGFREQRQGGQVILSPPSVGDQSGYISSGAQYSTQQSQPQSSLHQTPQPHPAQQAAYQGSRTVQSGHLNAVQAQPVSSTWRSSMYQYTDPTQAHVQSQQYSPPDSAQPYHSQDNSRPPLSQIRSYSSQQAGAEDASMSSNNGGIPATKALRSGVNNRQSVHNGLSARDGSSSGQQQSVPAFNASVVPPAGQGQGQAYQSQGKQQTDVGRVTPQPLTMGEDMSEEEVAQLIKDHKELRMWTQRLECRAFHTDGNYRREIHQGEEVLL